MCVAGVNDTVMRRLRSHAPHLSSLTLSCNCPVTVEGIKELRFMRLRSLHLCHLSDPRIGQQVGSFLVPVLCLYTLYSLVWSTVSRSQKQELFTLLPQHETELCLLGCAFCLQVFALLLAFSYVKNKLCVFKITPALYGTECFCTCC